MRFELGKGIIGYIFLMKWLGCKEREARILGWRPTMTRVF